jgi:hypothetical protein
MMSRAFFVSKKPPEGTSLASERAEGGFSFYYCVKLASCEMTKFEIA